MRTLSSIPNLTLPEFVLAEADGEHRFERALIDASTGREMRYGELAAAVRAVGAGLFARDVRQSEVLALCAPNSIEFVIAWYAASSIGATVTTLNPASTQTELAQQLKRAGARWLVTTGPLYEEKLRAAADESGIAESYLIGATGDPGPGALAFDDLAAGDETGLPPFEISPRDVAFLPFSSGTTGLPKPVALTHRNLVANLCQMRSVHRLTPEDTVIAVLPLFHIFGFQVTLNLALRAGATVVILPRFELKGFLNAIQTYGVTRAEVVPPIVLALANSELVDRYYLGSLRTVIAGAAPLGTDLARACAERIGCHVKQGFGMTELGGGTHIAPDGDSDHVDSIGPALPGIECRVVDPESGLDVGPNQPGELWMRSPSTMRGYLNDPDATAATIDADGWLHSGDIVTVDEDGWFRVADRIKELIKYKGFQVAPAELEDILLTHPAVADAAVVRSPDEQAGEVPKAFIVPCQPVSADELVKWVAERVANYKRIRRVEFVEQIPKSPSGKILRRLLIEREQCESGEDLAGRVILISGGGRGLGRLIAQSVASAEAKVGLLARSHDELTATVAEIKRAGGNVAAVAVDVTDRPALAAAVQRLREILGPVDVLINNAGVNGPLGPLWDVDSSEWWRTFEVNVGGAAALSSVVLPGMIAARRGRILNITSNAGTYRWPLLSAYAASKAALVKLTENLAAETRSSGVSVLSVDPGLLPIGLSDAALSSSAGPDTDEGRVFGWIRNRIASGQGADPDKAVQLILDLARGRADRLSGRHITVHEDLDALLERIDEIEADDLHTLRLRTAAAA